MRWLLDNIWIVIVIAGVIARMIQAARGQPNRDQSPTPEHEEGTFAEPELAEQTRRIREEIQRKIEERTRGGALTQAPRPEMQADEPEPPVVFELPRMIREVLAPRAEAVVSDRAGQMRAAEEMERQTALAEQLRQAEQMRTLAGRRTAFEALTADAEAAVHTQLRATMLENLRDPAALRRAFVLREVLGPPVALRR